MLEQVIADLLSDQHDVSFVVELCVVLVLLVLEKVLVHRLLPLAHVVESSLCQVLLVSSVESN